jgi:hypothetical protein
MAYSVIVRVSSQVSKFYFDDLIARHFADYKVCEYAKNGKEYSVALSKLFTSETINISKAIIAVAEFLVQEDSFNIIAYEQMPEVPGPYPVTKAKGDEVEGALRKAVIIADMIIEKAELEKERDALRPS